MFAGSGEPTCAVEVYVWLKTQNGVGQPRKTLKSFPSTLQPPLFSAHPLEAPPSAVMSQIAAANQALQALCLQTAVFPMDLMVTSSSTRFTVAKSQQQMMFSDSSNLRAILYMDVTGCALTQLPL